MLLEALAVVSKRDRFVGMCVIADKCVSDIIEAL